MIHDPASGTPPRSPQGDGISPGDDDDPPKGEILLQNPCRYPEAGARRHRGWLKSLVADLAGAASVTIRFVSDREMRRLSSTFRHLDKTTDVLSFPGGPEADAAGDVPYLGDVVVSVPTARRQAAERGHGVEHELRVLMLHGLLHCLGHDHETDDGAMERLERRLRRRWIDHG